MGIEIGIDEAGMGNWAGPMVVAAVAFPSGMQIAGLTDSKKITEPFRENSLIDKIYDEALFWCTQVISQLEIDQRGLSLAWLHAVRACAFIMDRQFDVSTSGKIILDGNRLVGLDYVVPEVKADAKYQSVSAASNIAKYVQCCAMDDLCRRFPGYGFNKNRGYGTAQHKEALERLGPCDAHRKSYKPIKRLLEEG